MIIDCICMHRVVPQNSPVVHVDCKAHGVGESPGESESRSSDLR